MNIVNIIAHNNCTGMYVFQKSVAYCPWIDVLVLESRQIVTLCLKVYTQWLCGFDCVSAFYKRSVTA